MKRFFNFLNEEDGEMTGYYSNFVFGVMICACTSVVYSVCWVNITNTLSSIIKVFPQ